MRSILGYDGELRESCRMLCGNKSDFGVNTAAIVERPYKPSNVMIGWKVFQRKHDTE